MRQPCTRLPPAALKWMKKESRGQVDAANTKETRVKMKRSPDRVGTIQRGEEQPPPNIVIELLRGQQEDTLHPQNKNRKTLEIEI